MGWFAKAWVVGVFGYSVARAAVVWPTLGSYGVDPWIFLAIDVITAFPYAYGQVRLVQAIRRRELGGTQIWALVVAATFFAPYAYIVGAGSGEMPTIAYVIIGILVVVFGVASTLRIVRQVREPTPRPDTAA